MTRTPDKLVDMVAANDKLLKAMIALLALKDENLLDELRVVFRHALHSGSEIGEANAAVWAHIHRELELIAILVEDEGPDAPSGQH
ncbi:MAG: hypothetical protein JSS35_07940 [Proteobacteria bacterium]|nr:hypothetical protein [Pseudomonadota bacterium]